VIAPALAKTSAISSRASEVVVHDQDPHARQRLFVPVGSVRQLAQRSAGDRGPGSSMKIA
jgi:hypothetical protein